jgi:YVTN family beta-propeller protein
MRMGIRWLTISILALLAVAMSRAVPATGDLARLYVTNSLGDDITVIDLGSLQPVGDIKVGEHVHGVCAQADGRRLFTTVESDHTLKVIDTATNTVLQTIPLTGRPNQCAATPDGRFVGIPIRDGNSVDIVDTTQGKVVKVLPVKVPHNCFNNGSNNDMYVSSMGDHEIDRIDLRTMEYVAKVPVGGIPRPYDVAKDGKKIYVALTSFHGFAVVDASARGDGKIERIELPPAPASGCTLEPDTPTHGLALSPNGKELWVTSLADNGIYVYDVATKKISKEIPTGKCPNWISFSPDGRYATVSNSASDDASIFDARTRKELARIKVGKGPKRLVAVNVPVK